MSTLSSSQSTPAPEPLPAFARDAWMLDPGITYLNHGCFGARLRSVSEAQQRWRERFEAAPVNVLDRRRDELVDDAKTGVGSFLGMRPRDFGFVTNATGGVNAVLRSLRFEAGDEIVTTHHVYHAVRQTMRWLAERAGAVVREARVPFPCPGPDAVVEAVRDTLGPRTRLLIVDHVTSPTAVRFPVEALIGLAREHGIPVLVDGAHAPGMLPLDVAALAADYYTGNLHKWIGTPPGAAFLWVHPDRQDGIHPPVISHYLGEGLAAEFAWQGTRDITPWLVAPDAIAAMDVLAGPESWTRIREHNHALAVWTQRHLCERWGAEPTTPRDGSMLGSMVSLVLPEALRGGAATPEALHDQLYDEHRIEVPVFEWDGRWIIRPCMQVYNTTDDVERLGDVLAGMADSV